VSVLAIYLAPLISLSTYQSSKSIMQNASGIWGKVKSQAQQAGSMAQGAINVSSPPPSRLPGGVELNRQNSGQRATTGGQGFMQSFSLPGESQKAAKILQHFLGRSTSDTRDSRLIDSESISAELSPQLYPQSRTSTCQR